MDLRYSAEEQQFRGELRGWLAEVLPTIGPRPSVNDWTGRLYAGPFHLGHAVRVRRVHLGVWLAIADKGVAPLPVGSGVILSVM